MKKRGLWKRGSSLLLSIVLILGAASQTAYADAAADIAGWDRQRPAALSVSLQHASEKAVIGIYRAGEWDGTKYVLTAEFQETGVDLEYLQTAEESTAAAEQLAACASGAGLEPAASGKTVDGTVTFEQLPQGIYLVRQLVGSGNTVTIAPFLVMLPQFDAEEKTYIYSLSVYPKSEKIRRSPRGGRGGGSDPDPVIPTTAAVEDPVPDRAFSDPGELPPGTVFDELIPLSPGFFQDPNTGEIYYILSEDVPLSVMAKMGDPGNRAALIVMLLSGTALIVLVLYRRKHGNRQP